MERLVIVVVVVVVAGIAAWIIERRRPAVEPAATGYRIPAQLHREDFARPDAPWLVAVFTSATCDSCRGMVDKALPLESDVVAVAEIEIGTRGELHERYAIDAVPTTVVVDADGVTRASFVGPATATDLWAAVAEVREPGSVPASCDSHVHHASDQRSQ